ncbi:MAG: RHS repeat-associated core domain-containing protein [Phycisphaerae bacterium]
MVAPRHSRPGPAVKRFTYDPYGRHAARRSLGEVPAANRSLATYGGLQWQHLRTGRSRGGRLEPTSGLYHFRNRDYDADLMRWTRQDAVGYVDGSSLYVTVLNNPLSLKDPQGLAAQTLPGGTAVPIHIADTILKLHAQGMSAAKIAASFGAGMVTAAAVTGVIERSINEAREQLTKALEPIPKRKNPCYDIRHHDEAHGRAGRLVRLEDT